ncbi:MAG: DUF5686 family protein [Saprospiraceae bacterium]
MQKQITLTIILLSLSLAAFSQSIIFKGRVIDDDTQEGVPFCDVYFEEQQIGASTDVDGYYELTTSNYGDSLSVIAMGYDVIKKAISAEPEQTINFRLGASDFMLSEVVITAGENPANIIIRDIIKNKKANRVSNLDSYECESYSKVELDLVNVDGIRGNKLMKPFEFIFENMDSLSDEKPFLPAYILERVSDVYHDKSKGKPKEFIKAQRVSGVENQTVNDFINSMHDNFSVYDNWIEILGKQFVSPFSNQGLFYYEYYMQDSTFIEDQWAYKLKFKPKRKQENTFFGTFWVMDSTFAVQRLDMRMSKDVNINLVSRIIIFQEFDYEEKNKMWLPEKQKIVIDFSPTKKDKTAGIIGRKTLSFKDYKINKPETTTTYQERDLETYSLEGIEKEDAYWQENRHEKLSANEQLIYEMVDSVKNVPMYRTYVTVFQTLVTGYKTFGPVDVGPYFSTYSYDKIQGHRVRLGARTSNQFSKKIRFGGYGAYGFKDKEFKYGADLIWVTSKRPRSQLELKYVNDVSFSSENTEEFVAGNLLSGIYRRPIYQKLIKTQEGKIAFERYWKKGWSNRLTLLNRRMDPYGGVNENGGGFNFTYIPDMSLPTAVDTIVNTTEVIVKLRYAFKEKFIEGNFARSSLGSKYPIIELQYAQGIKGVFGSKYDYQKLTFGMRGFFYMNPIGWMEYKFKAGKTFGQVPFLLAEVMPGNESYTYDKGAFNGVNKYEFAADAYASLILTHHFDGFFLNRIPLIRKLQWRTVTTFRTFYGSMSDENLAANQINFFDKTLPGKTTYTGFRVPSKYPYMEVGVGIENIFKLLRVDVMWRLNYLDNPDAKKLTFRVGFDFNF